MASNLYLTGDVDVLVLTNSFWIFERNRLFVNRVWFIKTKQLHFLFLCLFTEKCSDFPLYLLELIVFQIAHKFVFLHLHLKFQ